MSTHTVISQLPPLPEIDDFDLLFGVYTHKTLRPTSAGEPREWGDNERLAELGSQVLNSVVTIYLFSKRNPLVIAEEIRTWREHYTSAEKINNWLDQYELKQKLRAPPGQLEEILNDTEQMVAYFHSYIGALFISKGLAPVQEWIFKLIDPDVHIGSTIPASANPIQQPFTPTNPTPLPSSGPPIPLAASGIPVSLVNQTAMQRGVPINYVASQEGPSHLPTWTVRCYINNVDKGMGVAQSQKLAKQEAARRAWVAMGW